MAERMNPMLAAKRKEARGEILYLLDANRGLEQSMKVGWIVDALRSKPEVAAEVPYQVHYLEQEGYVRIVDKDETPELRPIKSAYILLTTKGQKVVEGIIEDPAIIFGDAERT